MNPLVKRAMINPARFAQNYSGKVNGEATAPGQIRTGSVANLMAEAKRRIKDPTIEKFVPKA